MSQRTPDHDPVRPVPRVEAYRYYPTAAALDLPSKLKPTPDQRKSIGGLVRQARLAEGLTLEAAADRAQMSHVTWAKIEGGEPVRDLSYAKIERTLGWRTGSIDQWIFTGVWQTSASYEAAARKEQVTRIYLDETHIPESSGPPLTRVETAIEVILGSDLPDVEKVAWIKRIRLEMDEAERQRTERAREIVQMWRRSQRSQSA